MTNGEILRGMTDPELADLLADEPWCDESLSCMGECQKCVKPWLEEEVEDPLRGITDVLKVLFPNADNKTLHIVAGQIKDRLVEQND